MISFADAETTRNLLHPELHTPDTLIMHNRQEGKPAGSAEHLSITPRRKGTHTTQTPASICSASEFTIALDSALLSFLWQYLQEFAKWLNSGGRHR